MVENENRADVSLSTFFQRLDGVIFSTLMDDYYNFTRIVSCFNVEFNVESSLAIWRWFNVDITSTEVTMLYQHIWRLKQLWVSGGYKLLNRFDVLCLSGSFLYSPTLSDDSCLEIPGYRLAKSDH